MQEHPEYRKVRRRTRVFGYGALGTGLVGCVLPLLPGLVFVLLGLSVLSVHSRRAHGLLVHLRGKYPQTARSLCSLESWVLEQLHLVTHTRTYLDIPTARGTTLSALLERSHIAGAPVAIVLHGASGTMETATNVRLAEVLRRTGASVLRFDAHDGLGTGQGVYTAFTTTGYRSDLTDVLAWVRTQEWWTGSVRLVGHSIGGTVAALAAVAQPDIVADLVLVNPTINGSTLVTLYRERDAAGFEKWKKEGARVVKHPLTGEDHTMGFTFVTDAAQYDLAQLARRITMPVTLLVSTPKGSTVLPEAERVFAETLPGDVRTVPLPGVPHTPESRHDLQVLENALS